MDGGTQIRVERVEVLSLPAGRFVAHRLRVQALWMHPGDTLHLWYGRSGYLVSQLHVLHYPELGPPDYWFDQSEVLDTLALGEGAHAYD